ncbi:MULTISPECIES: hypothetical protein [unclassified Streptomyces]|uniref:hypothetical protein n=1 Tax=unclassified Streptomyces TaxID=2593676 RepID=UPI0035D52E3A
METLKAEPKSNATVAKRAGIASYALALIGVFSALFGESTLRAIDAGSGHTIPYGVYSTAHYLISAIAEIGVPLAASLFGAALVLKRL